MRRRSAGPTTGSTAALVARSVLGVLAMGAVGAACSSGSSSTTTTVRHTTTTTTSGPADTSSTTSVASTTTNTGPGSAACATSQLAATVAGVNGAAGTIETTVALRNTSATTCVLAGYPTLQMVDTKGAALVTKTVDKGSYSFTSQPAAPVTIPPGQSGSFNIGYSDVPTGTETTCPTSAALQITPPAVTGHLTLTASLTPCNGGTLVVSPILTGATGGQ
jgi:hypothetical protein